MGQAVELGVARLSEAEAIATLSRHRVEGGLGWRWTPETIRRRIRDDETEVIVARSEGRVVGFALMQLDLDDAHLLLLGVGSDVERQGLGRRLLHFLEEEARAAGIRYLHLEVRANNRGARAFYQAHGFREAAYLRGYYQGREDAVRMVAQL
ncbi:MAG: ribosomal protein S18-alanine N-acetyltransferase [Deltaproteobacteria bacterium]|jgi:ribosomal-protein-alanine acetyltransferase|nr:ribosomal protein S18-alanine N-acetyltransferase [Deltaproteobacteria bacterium]